MAKYFKSQLKAWRPSTLIYLDHQSYRAIGRVALPTFPSSTMITKNMRFTSECALCDPSAGVFIWHNPLRHISHAHVSCLPDQLCLAPLFTSVSESLTTFTSSWRSAHIFPLPIPYPCVHLCLISFSSSVKKPIQMLSTQGPISWPSFIYMTYSLRASCISSIEAVKALITVLLFTICRHVEASSTRTGTISVMSSDGSP